MASSLSSPRTSMHTTAMSNASIRDLRRQRGGLLPSRGRLDLHISTAKAEVLHLHAPRQQELVGTGKQIRLLPELVQDIPLPLEEYRLPEGPGLELLGRQNRVQVLRENSKKDDTAPGKKART